MKISIIWVRASTETWPEFLDNKYIYFPELKKLEKTTLAEFLFFGHAEVSEILKTSSKLPIYTFVKNSLALLLHI